jgi:hypothetical protein
MLYAAPAVNWVTGLANTQPMQIDPSVMRWFGRPFPLMIMTYIGGLKVAWHILTFWLLGVSVETARLASVLLGVVAIAYTFGFARRMFDLPTAVFSTLLMGGAVDYILYTSRDMTIVVMMVCKMAALYYGWRFAAEARKRYLMWAGLFLGWGVYDKASFLWFVFALSAYVLTFQRHRLRSWSIAEWLTLTGSFLAGAIVFITFNIVRLGATFSSLGMNTGTMANSMGVGGLFVERGTQFVQLMSGDALMYLFTETHFEAGWLRTVVPVLGAALVLGALAQGWKESAMRDKVVLFVVLWTLTLAQTVYSPTVLSLHHVAIAWPFHWLLMGITLSWLWKRARGRLVAVGLTLALTACSAVSLVTIYRHLEKKGATSNWCETINELSDFLVDRDEPVVAVSWGFTNNLIVTSAGRVKLVRIYFDLMQMSDSERVDRLQTEYRRHRNYIAVLHHPTDYDHLIRTAAESGGFAIAEEKTFFQKNGRPVYRFYRVQPANF